MAKREEPLLTPQEEQLHGQAADGTFETQLGVRDKETNALVAVIEVGEMIPHKGVWFKVTRVAQDLIELRPASYTGRKSQEAVGSARRRMLLEARKIEKRRRKEQEREARRQRKDAQLSAKKATADGTSC